MATPLRFILEFPRKFQWTETVDIRTGIRISTGTGIGIGVGTDIGMGIGIVTRLGIGIDTRIGIGFGTSIRTGTGIDTGTRTWTINSIGNATGVGTVLLLVLETAVYKCQN
jgi:hypothetical protein